MTDEEILDAWHQAKRAYEAAKASGTGLDDAFAKSLAAEKAAIDRFGVGEHKKRYDAHYPKPSALSPEVKPDAS